MAAFIDTNILVYADDAAFPQKQTAAAELIARLYRDGDAVISSQVMQEYYQAAISKLKLPADFAAARLRFFASFQVVTPTPQLVIEATDLHRLRSLSFWDALIVQAAVTSGCNTLYSGDLNANEVINGVKIVNPFR